MMRIIFAGSPAIAVPSLEALSKMDGIKLIAVLTNPDTARGRSGSLVPTDIAEAASSLLKNGKDFSILKPNKLDAAAREEIAALKPDLLVSFAYGHIFGPKFLALFPLGGINIHPSLLPKYRGASPIQAAILNRDLSTGISIQKIALEVDSGNILAKEEFSLTGKETASSLSETVSVKAPDLLPAALKKIIQHDEGSPQDHNIASYSSIIKKEDAYIDWKKDVYQIEAKIRAFNPWPLCRTIHKGRELFIIKADVYKTSKNTWDLQESGTHNNCANSKCGIVTGTDNGILIQTGEGILRVSELQYQGKKALFWKDFLNGARNFLGTCFD